MERLRRSNGLGLYRTGLSDDSGYRYGVLAGMDVLAIRGGVMREAIIILTILIIAAWIWRPRKGGKR